MLQIDRKKVNVEENGLRISRRLNVPTGEILIVDGELGKLEMLSIGDYGQAVNLNQNSSVPDGLPLLPLTEKWVVTISTQYGCSMNCNFCDVPKVGPGRNATKLDLIGQIVTALKLEGKPNHTKRLNVHFARMGEPSWNGYNVINCALWAEEALKQYNPHLVVSTMMPKNNSYLIRFIDEWMYVKNYLFKGNAGLQLSINSTDEEERKICFGGNALPLADMSELMKRHTPVGRKITLNFAVANYAVDPKTLLDKFSPDHYIVKLTPMHKTSTAIQSGTKTEGEYTDPEPYVELRDEFNRVGYETLVFIASNDEDSSRITCGNAILSGSMPHKFTEQME